MLRGKILKNRSKKISLTFFCHSLLKQTTENSLTTFWNRTLNPHMKSPNTMVNKRNVLIFEDTETHRIWTEALLNSPSLVPRTHPICPFALPHKCLTFTKPKHKNAQISVSLGIHFWRLLCPTKLILNQFACLCLVNLCFIMCHKHELCGGWGKNIALSLLQYYLNI